MGREREEEEEEERVRGRRREEWRGEERRHNSEIKAAFWRVTFFDFP